MDSRSNRAVRAGVLALVAIGLLACGPADPLEEALENRARWDVTMLSMATREDGTGLAQFRLAGPVNRKLDALTIRIDLLGPDERVVESVWHTFDLTDIERGVPTERTVSLPATDPPTEGVTFDRVLSPAADERTRIVELRGLSGEG